MDADTVIPANGYEVVHQNGGHDQLLLSGVDESILSTADKLSDIAVLNGNLESVKLEGHGIDNKSSLSESRDDAHTGIPQEVEESKMVTSKSSKHLKSEGNKRDEKPLHAEVTPTTSSKKSKDGKGWEAVASSFNLELPAKSRSFNDQQSRSNVPKQGGKSSAASPVVSGEQMKLKPLKKGTPSTQKEDTQPTDPTAEDAKLHRAGALPNYGFSFKCDERAEKRKEFYTKLGEKIHAREIEKTNQQAKSKETQEAEIKLLRKSLTFKATPLPNFYQEPPPLKPELKKIPTTRAKSPKLGRRKNTGGEESEENSGPNQRFGRLSLDAVSCNNPNKGPSLANPKKPPRKSLPKLPSEKTSLSGGVVKTTESSKTVDKQEADLNNAGGEEKCASSIEMCDSTSLSQRQEEVRVAEPNEAQPDADGVQETMMLEHQAHPEPTDSVS